MTLCIWVSFFKQIEKFGVFQKVKKLSILQHEDHSISGDLRTSGGRYNFTMLCLCGKIQVLESSVADYGCAANFISDRFPFSAR